MKLKTCLVFIVMLCTGTSIINASAIKKQNTESNYVMRGPDINNIYLILYEGFIGGDHKARMEFAYGKNGEYVFLDMRRTLKLSSYNRNTGKLVLTAYANGKKIGYFSGILHYDMGNAKYSGTFVNTKNGAKLNFCLTGYDCDGD